MQIFFFVFVIFSFISVFFSGGRLYGAKISVEYYLHLFPYTARPTLYRVWKLFRYLCPCSRVYCAPNMDYTCIYCVWILCACAVVQTQAICNCRI